MNQQFLQQLGLMPPHHDSEPIIPKTFVDLFMDVVGCYALGHHDAKAFLSAVAKREPHFRLSETQVKWVWAKLDDQSFEEVDEQTEGATPITLVEVYN